MLKIKVSNFNHNTQKKGKLKKNTQNEIIIAIIYFKLN